VPSLPGFSDHALAAEAANFWLRNNRQINYQVVSNQATQTHCQQMRLGSDAHSPKEPTSATQTTPPNIAISILEHSPSSSCMVTFI